MGAKSAKIIKEALQLMRNYPSYKFVIESVMVVEYFKLHYPDLIDELKQRVNENKIELIGGMVVAPDTLLPNGESLVRQILYGKSYFKENFNMNSKTGYLLDSFGQTPQLPQILKKSGFDYLIFVRGASNRNLPQEFLWKAFDGSNILTHWLSSSYQYILPPFTGGMIAPFFPFIPLLGTLGIIPQNFKIYEILKKIFPPIKYIFQRISVMNKGIPMMNTDISCGLRYTINNRIRISTTNNVFILCGMDNTPLSSNIIDTVSYFQKKAKNYDTKLALPNEFLSAVKSSRSKFPIIEPFEFLGYPDRFTGTWSNRISLKQKIRMLENLFYVSEVFSTISSIYTDNKYQKNKITKAIWRILCSDFHDGICGCHVDAAYDQIMKMLKLSQIQLDRILNDALNSLIKNIDTSRFPKDSIAIIVFNPISSYKTDIATLFSSKDLSNHFIKDNNAIIPLQKDIISNIKNLYLFNASEIPPIGYKCLYLEQKDPSHLEKLKSNFIIKRSEDNQIIEVENDLFLLNFENRKLKSIKVKKNNTSINASKYYINDLRVFNDRGDSYLHGKMPKKIYTTFDNHLSIVEDGPVRLVIQIKSKLKCKSKWFFKPINEIIQYIILYHQNLPRIDFFTTFKNRIRNIRIQACFPVNIKNPVFHSEVPYGFIERNIVPERGKSCKAYKKKFSDYDRVFPVINWMDASNFEEKKGITIINKGLPEYEIGENKEFIFLTLLRSTGYIANIFPGAVPMVLGPFYSIPKALELRNHEFKYSLYFHNGDIKNNALASKALSHNISLIVKTTTIQKGNLPENFSFIRIQPSNFLITAIKKSESNAEDIIIRILEISNNSSKGKFIFAKKVKQAYLVNLIEEPIKELKKYDDNTVEFDANPQEILTFKIKI